MYLGRGHQITGGGGLLVVLLLEPRNKSLVRLKQCWVEKNEAVDIMITKHQVSAQSDRRDNIKRSANVAEALV